MMMMPVPMKTNRVEETDITTISFINVSSLKANQLAIEETEHHITCIAEHLIARPQQQSKVNESKRASQWQEIILSCTDPEHEKTSAGVGLLAKKDRSFQDRAEDGSCQEGEGNRKTDDS